MALALALALAVCCGEGPLRLYAVLLDLFAYVTFYLFLFMNRCDQILGLILVSRYTNMFNKIFLISLIKIPNLELN